MNTQLNLAELTTFADWCRAKDRLPAETNAQLGAENE